VVPTIDLSDRVGSTNCLMHMVPERGFEPPTY
jgi:hypothetical protein